MTWYYHAEKILLHDLYTVQINQFMYTKKISDPQLTPRMCSVAIFESNTCTAFEMSYLCWNLLFVIEIQLVLCFRQILIQHHFDHPIIQAFATDLERHLFLCWFLAKYDHKINI